ncbi:MAG: extracellular solute-binding protein [Ruminococcaceae bacterium]|nr:extracellular solute-binding protein [Oscillospiraceae bacterium]
MKKIIALLLAVLVVVGMFAGCNQNPTTQKPTKPTAGGDSLEFPYEVDENGNPVYGDLFKDDEVEWWISSNYDINSDMYVFKKLEELIGCKINVKCFDGEQYNIKISTALKASQLPDLCSLTIPYTVYNVYGDQGAFVNLIAPENLAKMPNFKKVMEIPEVIEQAEFYKSEAGGLYGFVRYNTERLVNYGWCYRKDIFEEHGIELWHDDESFLNVLRQLRELYPDSHPLTGASMFSAFNRIVNQHGLNSCTNAYDWEEGEWFIGATHEGYYETMMIFKTAWNEGLLDPDVFTNKTGDITAAIVAGDSFVYNSWIGYLADQNYAGKQIDPNFQVAYGPQVGDQKADQLPLVSATSCVINAQSDCIDACLAIWNAMYADEGRILTVGEEGVTYKMENGKKVYLNADGSVMGNPTIQTLEEQFGLWNSNLYVLSPRDSVYFTFSDVEQEAQEIGSKGGFFPRIPAENIPQEMGKEYYDKADEMYREIEQFCAKFISDENLGRADWEAKSAELQQKYSIVPDILNGNY